MSDQAPSEETPPSSEKPSAPPEQDKSETEKNLQAQSDVQQAIYAEEVICSLTAQILLVHQTPSAPALWNEVIRENHETCYHLLTAMGCIKRMQCGDWHPQLLSTLVHCLYYTRTHLRSRAGYLNQLCTATSTTEKTAIQALMHWAAIEEEHLQCAMFSVQAIIGLDRWNELAEGK
ncbi:hypothetical protein [Mechercharimyces sp. CAU 1602]|uniref:hypothetical protein n=1 Tax=Mechercharimyces sp. CAU 1602 TaxID=2973933 RepID=UPI002163D895|nr:hypothetical protein [Mechercharimyces sp. CAU 1602]MCS1352044.1 hypothetical protein [Mechercharimyces sp. CAU 1602]